MVGRSGKDEMRFAPVVARPRTLPVRIAAVEAIALAGFMRVLTPAFVERFEGRMLNIHPSLLPKYPGLHTHQRAIEAGDAEAGCVDHHGLLQPDRKADGQTGTGREPQCLA